MSVLDNVERVHIAPLRARVDSILDEVEVITGKVKHAQDWVMPRSTRLPPPAASSRTVKSKTWPILG